MKGERTRPYPYLGWTLVFAGMFFVIGQVYTTPLLEKFDTIASARIYALSGLPLFDRFFLIVTNIGSAKVTFPLFVMLTVIYLYNRDFRTAAVLLVNLAGSRYANWLLKTYYARERPDLEHLTEAGYYSFPSGHAMNAVAFFGFIALLVWESLKRGSGRSAKAAVASIWIFILLVGFSRIHLGVHYPVDVIAGFIAGASWLMITILLYRSLKK